jgi:carboxylesterase type B
VKKTVLMVLLCGVTFAQSPREATEPFLKDGAKAVEMKIHERVFKTTPQGELKLRIYEPASGGENRPCAVFFFGGGWKGGSLLQFGKHCEFLASHGYVAITPQYRTEQGHGFFNYREDDNPFFYESLRDMALFLKEKGFLN